jgi:hypothetical protein
MGILEVRAEDDSTNQQEWQNQLGQIRCRVDPAGVFFIAMNSPPSDLSIATGECAIWFDKTHGTSAVKFRARDASGALVSGSVALS